MYGLDIQFNQDTKLVDVDGFKKFPKTYFLIICADKEQDFVKAMETILFLKGIYPISRFSIS